MSHKNGLFAVFTVTLLSIAGWFAVLQTINPFTTDWFSRTMFYVFLVFAVSGAGCLLIYYFFNNKNNAGDGNVFTGSLRVGLSIGIALGGLIVLETINVLNVLSATVYLIAILLIEFYIRSRGKRYV